MGFNMSWIFVDQIELSDLYEALDVKSTGEKPVDDYEFGTTRVPLAGLKPAPGWCAVFARYSFVLDIAISTHPPRLARLPANSRAITCVVLEHANISYASLWQGGRQVWEARHQPNEDQSNHLDFWGDMPVGFLDIWGAALQRQRENDAKLKPGEWSTDYLFNVPLDTATMLTGFEHTRPRPAEFRDVTTLVAVNGNDLTKLGEPPFWWQTVGSTHYGPPLSEAEIAAERKAFEKSFRELLLNPRFLPH